MSNDSIYEHKPIVMIQNFDSKSVNEIIQKIDQIENDYSPSQPIVLHINTHGGPIKGMSMIYNRVKTLVNPVVTYTSSQAMSAGAILLSTLGTKGMRVAAPNSSIMVHEIQAGSIGDIKDLEDSANYLKQLNKTWMEILAKSMGLKNGKDIRKLIDKHAIGHNVYLTPQKAKQLRLIDEIGTLKLTPFHGWEISTL